MSQWTEADVQRILASRERGTIRKEHVSLAVNASIIEPKPSKYRNVKTQVDGITFDSRKEANYYADLKLREQAGEIRDLRLQVPFALYTLDETRPGRVQLKVCDYVADFVFHDANDVRHIVDAKGKRTREFMLKAKWLELQSGVIVELV